MLRILISVAALSVAAPTLAADLPMYEAAPAYAAPAPSSWTGAYIGAQAGYSWGQANNRGVANTSPDGGVVGGYAGYDHQFDGSPAVIGVDTDLNYNGNHDRRSGVGNDLNWSGATRGKIGVAGERVMVYGAAGVAYGEHKVRAAGADDKTAIGYTVGGGVEARVADNVTARAEYRYNDYGKDRFTPGVGKVKSDLTENRVMGGVAYKFGGF